MSDYLMQIYFIIVYGVDLFFDMPQHPNPTVYTYCAYSTTMYIQYNYGAVNVQCDWLGTLSLHLDKVCSYIYISVSVIYLGIGVHGKCFPNSIQQTIIQRIG